MSFFHVVIFLNINVIGDMVDVFVICIVTFIIFRIEAVIIIKFVIYNIISILVHFTSKITFLNLPAFVKECYVLILIGDSLEPKGLIIHCFIVAHLDHSILRYIIFRSSFFFSITRVVSLAKLSSYKESQSLSISL